MISSIIRASLRNKLLVIVSVLLLILAGIFSIRNIPLDAVPDITSNQVQIVTNAPATPPQEIEQLITFPLERAVQNLPGVKEVRSVSRYGLSVITVVFEEWVSTLDGRQLVREQMDQAASDIPSSLGTPKMMPITTGLGEVYQYVLQVDSAHSGKYSLTDLRTIQDWIVKRQLAGIQGIIDISSFGGYIKEYEIAVDPVALNARKITLPELINRVREASENSGGSYIQKDDQSFYIRTIGRVQSEKEIAKIFLGNRSGRPLQLKDVAEIREGHPPRYGAMTMNGKGEVVGGITLMLKGENSDRVTRNVKQRVSEVAKTLPDGVSIQPFLDRSELVDRTTRTILFNLTEGGLIVILVLILLMGNLRAGLLVASIVPLSLLFAFILMRWYGVSANLMSLGAIDFGIIVDSAVILIEGTVFYLASQHLGAKLSQHQMDRAVEHSLKDLMRPASFGLFTTLVVFLPILALSGIEGKMFRPMAMTLIFALIGVFILSLTYVPVMSSLLFRNQTQKSSTWADRFMGILKKYYQPTLRFCIQKGRWMVLIALLWLGSAFLIFQNMGGEFIPDLEEGDLAMQMTIPPGSSLNESIATATKAEQILLESFPEVEKVVSKIGTAEVPTDPMAIEEADIMIILKAKEEWQTADNTEALINAMDEKLTNIPGASFDFTQPIQLRFNELMTGVKSDVAIKVFGTDTEQLKSIADSIGRLIQPIQGAGDIKVEQTEGLQQLQIKYDRAALARYGIAVRDANTIIRSAFAGQTTGFVFEGERKFDLVVRLEKPNRQHLDLDRVRIQTRHGSSIPLSQIAEVKTVSGPMQISRDNAHRRVNIGVNIRNRDVASFIKEVQDNINNRIQLPAGYFVEYGGEFENLQSATERLWVAVPLALVFIFILLYLSFHSVPYALLIFTSVPFSTIGGIYALYLRDMPMSISAGIGFIALFGVTVLDGLVLINAFEQFKTKENSLMETILKGTKTRLRPVLMTALVAALGFLPMALSTTAGAEVQRPLATVVIGGLASSTLLTLFLLPILYMWVEGRSLKMPKQMDALIITTLVMVAIGMPSKAQQVGQLQELKSQLPLEEHPLLLSKKLNVNALDQRASGAYNLPGTQLKFQYGSFNTGNADNAFQIEQRIHWPTYYRNQKRLRNAETNMASADQALTSLELKKNAFILYFSAQYAVDQRRILQHRDSILQIRERQIQQQLNTGEGSRLDLINIQQQRSAVKLEILNLKQLLERADEVWKYYHQNETASVPRNGLSDQTLLSERSFQSQSGISGHPELSLAETRANRAKRKINFEKSRAAPELIFQYQNMTLLGETSMDNPNIQYGPSDRFSAFSVGVGVPLAFNANRAEIESSKIQLESEILAQENTRSKLESELSAFFREWNRKNEQITLYLNDILPRNRELQTLATQQLQEGQISIIEWSLIMEKTLEQTSNYYKTLYDRLTIELEILSLTNEL